MLQNYIGELSALATAFCWAITAMSFQIASKKIGSLSVNLIRLFIGFLCLTIFAYFSRGLWFPTDASYHNWQWLLLSGVVGIFLGDIMLFHAFETIGARVSLLITSMVPPIAAITGYIILNEKLTYLQIIGMIVTLTGISLVVLSKQKGEKQVKFNYPLAGILLAIGGSFGQAIGLVLSKYGMQTETEILYNPFGATQIRIIGGAICFILFFTVTNRWSRIKSGVKNKEAMLFTTLGSIFGPFLGISLSLVAVQYTTTGVASTIIALVPVIIIPPAVIFFKEKVTLKEVIGAFIAVGGVVLCFI